MKKALALALSLVLIIQASGCARKPRLDITSFEKHVLSDLELEKKESTDGQAKCRIIQIQNSITTHRFIPTLPMEPSEICSWSTPITRMLRKPKTSSTN